MRVMESSTSTGGQEDPTEQSEQTQHDTDVPVSSSPSEAATEVPARATANPLPLTDTDLYPAPTFAGPSRPRIDVPIYMGEDETPTERRERRRAKVQKLHRILGCALCPQTAGVSPPLHRPVTLPCGHTLSAPHLSLPVLPFGDHPQVDTAPLMPTAATAAATAAAQRRIALWSTIMCPIPTCRRYSPESGVSPASVAPIVGLEEDETAERARAVQYYPPPEPLPTASLPQEDSESDLSHNDTQAAVPLDICVDKILLLVTRELGIFADEDAGIVSRRTDYEGDSDSDDEIDFDNDDEDADGTLRVVDSRLRRPPKRARLADRGPGSASDVDWKFEKDLLTIVECDVCALMMYEPVTTPCQHSFCARCLSRSLDHSPRCPVCRQTLPAFLQDQPTNKVILSILKTMFPDDYAERQRALELDERDARLDTPIFVCTLAFPGMPTILHVFEPRYRLMIRRCIESSSPRFGMVMPARGTSASASHLSGVMEYGTMLEIQSVQMLSDGRSMVETVGTHRFRLLEKGNLDGYTVGRVERIDDISSEDEHILESEAVARRQAASARPGSASSSISSLPPAPPIETVDELLAVCRAFIDQLRSGSAPWLLQRLNHTYGTMPNDPSAFSYWMALVMPIDEYEKARLLPIRSPRLRLKLIVYWIESLRSSWWFSNGCVTS